MSSNIRAQSPKNSLLCQNWRARVRHHFMVLTVLMLLLAASLLNSTTAQAAAPAPSTQGLVTVQPNVTPTVRADTQLIFSVGTLSKVDKQAITVAFNDGQSETYHLVPGTTFQTQNGDAQVLADLDVGNDVVVIANETDLTALTIVNGGESGFHEAGPADIRGHTDECAPCEPTASPTPSL